jgi:alkanesulfonate monooxygenase SsuD/methylene tetrahydromethanopterin reductase-like flavin-dependent oxidoreductase (luciferase family)
MESIFSIKDNIQKIKDKIREAEVKAGRKENSVSLMAVSKFHPAEAVEEAKKYVTEAIRAGADITIGHGSGPVNHGFNPLQMLVCESE